MSTVEETGKLDAKAWRTIAVVLLGPFMTQLDSTVVNVSLPKIAEDLHSPIAEAQWIISGYLLALALMLPLNGWAVDRVGAKKLYLGCFTAFTLTSLICGVSHTMEQLVCARVLQGIAGGLLAPMTQYMVARIAGRQMARVVGYAAIPILLAPLLGPVAAGAILTSASWPWLFFLNLPIGVLAVTLAIFLLPQDDEVAQKRPFDFLGFILISPGLACVLYGFEHFKNLSGILTLGIGVALIAGFVFDARDKKGRALVDLRLFKIRNFFVATRTQFFSNGLTYAGQFLLPLYLMKGAGLSAVQTGLALAPMGIGMLCVSPMMGFLTDKFGCRKVSVTGVLVNLAGTLPFFWMILHEYSLVMMVFCMLARGAGQGAAGVPALSAAYAALPKEKLSSGTTATNIVQRLGGPIATTLMAIVVSYASESPPSFTDLHTSARTFIVPFAALLILQSMLLASAIHLPARIEKR
jgi:EmrB/QacA subfamily drug resistance transporter